MKNSDIKDGGVLDLFRSDIATEKLWCEICLSLGISYKTEHIKIIFSEVRAIWHLE